MGKPLDPGYWRRYRATHPAYRERERARSQARPKGDRSAEYANRPSRAIARLPVLYPDLNHGTALAYWEDELRMDIAQERALATLEGRDPDQAAARYHARESAWHAITGPILPSLGA